jgi:hypothetical protein
MTRRRRDGQQTAEQMQQQRERDCPGHVASDDDPKVCRHCGTHVDEERPPDDGVDDLASILPPGEGAAPIAEAVAERQADAATDSAPAIGGGAPPVDEGANRLARLEIVRGKFTRLDAITKELKALNDEKDKIMGELEDESGFQRTAVSAVRKLKGLGSAAAIKKHLTNREELESIFIKPILDEAEAGQSDE